MRIIGGHDYYDSAMSYGHDTFTVYVRGDTELPYPEMQKLGIYGATLHGKLRPVGGEEDRILRRQRRYEPWWWGYQDHSYEHKGVNYEISCPTVILCGKRYQGILMHTSKAGVGTLKDYFFWTAADFLSWLEEHGLEFRTVKSYNVAEYFACTALHPDALVLMMERRWSVLVHKDRYDPYARYGEPWYIDQPVLKDVQFYKLMPPTTVFQEIDMWIGGVLPVVGRPTVEISDKDKIAKHGMDKWSFRKQKKD